FQFLQVTAELRELGSLRIVAQRHVRFKRGFVTKQLVFVSLVWTKSDVDWRVEIHPGDVALVVIVGAKRVGAFVQKVFESCIGCQRGRFAQQRRRGTEIFFVSFAV